VGPLLLSRLMDLNEVQEGVLNICFRVADEQGLLVLDLKDFAPAVYRGPRRRADRAYGNVSKTTVGTIQRQLLVLENQAATSSSASLRSRSRTHPHQWDGRGYINILAADKLMGNSRLYATFLLWLLSSCSAAAGNRRSAQAQALLLL
jgi:DNA helicase HerA-like ATPase